MKKMFAVPVLILSMIYASCAPAMGQDTTDWSGVSSLNNLGISHEDLDEIKDLIDERSHTVIQDITLSPEQPAANQPVTVTAAIFTQNKPFGEEIWSAAINYSTDGGLTMFHSPMEKQSQNGNLWTGTIPAQSAGAQVIYGLQAVTIFDEMYVETMCPSTGGRQIDYDAVSPECKNHDNVFYCEAQRPRECLFPMSMSSEKYASNTLNGKTIPEDLRMLSTRVGYNDTRVFLQLDVKGQVTSGTYSPMNAHVYVAGWLNPDTSASETGVSAILKQGAVVIYAPLNPTNKCALYFLRAGTDLITDNRSVTCESMGSHLLISIDREAINSNPSRTLEFMFMTFRMLQMSPPDTDLTFLTKGTIAALRNRQFNVH